ncbi:MFS transporter [Ponticaulis sp.]|uniref:spinster family MFS transporter n=1 Tax=Ponticaulis sp. TaxID=2020902 RepID=UPI000B676A20|nr:MFS transporter [Ponticaulis sp.]MAI90197.1 MFS transporter [Ponticaulis sp.]OUX99844.1 MAG: MFS transporter [Hyphomonadaceae bacterium TMED5]|tara:strand:- start:162801 stop:164333 length:1533 start_codon:yes stop_codon:yes gene_type:complete
MTDTTAASSAGEQDNVRSGENEGFGSFGYRTYVLNALLIIYILNFVDRALLSVVARPLKAELGISDTAFGWLTGLGFALLYTIVGIPIARIAERRNRVIIISICVALWSVMTALCGLAMEVTIFGVVIGGFWVLLACRVGVGIGEAGCTPPANSLISDYYPPKKRSSAMGYYAMGVTLGTLVANLIAGPITDMFNWRVAFFVLGIPGVVVALILYFTVKEPPRGYSEPAGTVKGERASFSEGLKELFSKRSYWWMCAGATGAAFCGYAISAFQSLYIQRTFDLTAGQASVWFNVPAYLGGAIGTFMLGYIASKMKSASAIAWLSAGGLVLCVPFFGMAFTTTNMIACVIGLAIGNAVKYGYLAAQYTIAAGVVSMRVRATSTAIMLFVINLLGYGLGPPFAGIVSDFWFKGSLSEAGYMDVINRSMCDAGQQAITFAQRASETALTDMQMSEVLAGISTPLSLEQYAFCLEANQSSTSASMLTLTVMYAFAGIFFALSAMGLKRDMVGQS